LSLVENKVKLDVTKDSQNRKITDKRILNDIENKLSGVRDELLQEYNNRETVEEQEQKRISEQIYFLREDLAAERVVR
jgi:hypothetical protein